MKDNLNDVIPEDTQDRNDKLNEILNSVDSRLQPKNNISGWEDEINSVLAKHSRKSDIDDILCELDRKSEEITAPEVPVAETPQDNIQELVEQLTNDEQISAISSHESTSTEILNDILPASSDITKYNEEFAPKNNIPEMPAETVYDTQQEKAINETVPPVSSESQTVEISLDEISSKTIVYNVPRRTVPKRPAVLNDTSQTAKPAKKMVRVEKAHTPESFEPQQSTIKSIPEQSRVNLRAEKNIPKKRKKSMKEKFLDLFPQKQDPVPEKIRKVVFMCSLCAIVICGYMVGDYYIDLGKSKNLHEEIADIYEPYLPERGQNVATIYEPNYERTYTMLDGAKKLLDMNPDVIGYITIPDTPIANPVMQSGDNEKYLDQNINGESSRAGELFLDYRNNFDRVADGKLSVPNSENLVIYGHNMKNEQMFGSLKYYQWNNGYYNEHPVIYLNSNYECYTYKIFSYFILDALDESETAYDCWNKFDFEGEEDFYNFVNEAKKRSMGLNDVDVKYGDKLLTLSTCNTTLGDRGRLIVMGRLLRDGEDINQGTDKNIQNANIKWPSIYYQQKPNEKYNPDAEFVPYG